MSEITAKEYIAELVKKAKVAQKYFEANYTSQLEIDKVVRAIGKTIYDARVELAKDAADETHMGDPEKKIGKIIATTTSQWNIMRGRKSVGVIDNPRDEPGVTVYAKPMGVIGCVMPSTNPIITIAANAMMSIKCRNACIIAAHPAAKNCSQKTVNMVRDAIAALGAPADLIQCIAPEMSSVEATNELLRACDVNIATGGPGMVKAVYSCGRPGFGVGQGNTQEIVCEDWDDYDYLTNITITNRAQDNGVPCTSDQTLYIPVAREEEFKTLAVKNGAYLIEDEDLKDRLRKLVFPDGKNINRDVVGRAPQVVGKMLGLDIPDTCRTLLAKYEGVAEEDVLAKEILFPLMRYKTYEKFEDAVDQAVANLEMEGAGHNSAIWTYDSKKVEYAALRFPVSRLQHNQHPFGIDNGMPTTSTLGCGAWGNNSISENLEWYHLYQTTRVSEKLEHKRKWQDGDWDCFDICPTFC